MTSMELSRHPQRAMDAALEGPVFITYYGKPAYVLLSIEEYNRLAGSKTPASDVATR
jgi:prevent-host-death family protein